MLFWRSFKEPGWLECGEQGRGWPELRRGREAKARADRACMPK